MVFFRRYKLINWSHTGTILGCMAVAVFLVFFRIANTSIWMDEAKVIRIASMPWYLFWKTIINNEPYRYLYVLALHVWINFFGTSEAGVRSLSAIFGLIGIPFIYLIAKRIFNKKTALVAMWLYILNPLFIRYAQEAQGYSALLTLSLILTYIFLKLLDKTTVLTAVFYLLFAEAALYTHHFALMVIISHFLFLLIAGKKSGKIRWLYFPVLVFAFPILLINVPAYVTDWIPIPGITEIYRFLVELSGGHYLLLIIYLYLVIKSCYEILRLADNPAPNFKKLLIFWLFAPLLLTIGYSLFVRPVFVNRYLIISLPPFVLLAASGIQKINLLFVKTFYLAVIIVFSLLSLFNWYTLGKHPALKDFVFYQEEDWRSAANFVVSHSTGGDALIFYAYYGDIPYLYYQQTISSFSYPKVISIASEDSYRGETLPPNVNLINTLKDFYPRVWLITSHDASVKLNRPAQKQLILDILANTYPVYSFRTVNGISIYLFSKN